MANDSQTTVQVVTVSGTLPFYATVDGGGNYTFQSTPRTNGAEVSPTNPLPVVQSQSISPGAPSGGLTLGTGGTSQVLAAGGTVLHGGWIKNPLSATQQGIGGAESIFVNITGGSALLTAGAQSVEVEPGGLLPLPAGIATAVSWNAVTTGHKISVVIW